MIARFADEETTSYCQNPDDLFKTAVLEVQHRTEVDLRPVHCRPRNPKDVRVTFAFARRAATRLQGRLLKSFAFLDFFSPF